MQNFCVFWMLLLQDDEAQFRLECWQHSNASLTMKDADKSQKKHGACSVGSEVTSSSRKCFLTTAARCHSRARRGIATWHLWLPAGFARAPRLSGNVLKALAESTPKIDQWSGCLPWPWPFGQQGACGHRHGCNEVSPKWLCRWCASASSCERHCHAWCPAPWSCMHGLHLCARSPACP